MPEVEVTSGDHLGDLLSALVDGELTTHEEAAAREHLDGCADCRDELAATEATAALVRGLPAVDPRFGFYERMLRGRRFAPDRRGQRKPGRRPRAGHGARGRRRTRRPGGPRAGRRTHTVCQTVHHCPRDRRRRLRVRPRGGAG
ncbi:MAG TPA: zf-HC2 domain-containing protein [Acidimicrobiales bacterium]|nr:zf-HC2 domain-containing protein [Acidimicrobiales bacterium]